jgi:hypothetical protein
VLEIVTRTAGNVKVWLPERLLFMVVSPSERPVEEFPEVDEIPDSYEDVVAPFCRIDRILEMYHTPGVKAIETKSPYTVVAGKFCKDP